jgi:hypothetical protein
MQLITIELARDHVKGEGDDDALIRTYAASAEAACARHVNRALYATTAALNAAVAGVAQAMQDAYTAYDIAIVTAASSDDDRVAMMLTMQAQAALDAATVNAERITHGLALDKQENAGIVSAILLTLGTLYENRAATVSGQGAAAVEVPLSATYILDLYRWIGPL